MRRPWMLGVAVLAVLVGAGLLARRCGVTPGRPMGRRLPPSGPRRRLLDDVRAIRADTERILALVEAEHLAPDERPAP